MQNIHTQEAIKLLFKQYKNADKDYDDGRGYFYYLEALNNTRKNTDRALNVRIALENLIYVYYTRERLNWPEELERLDTLANRIKYLTPNGASLGYGKGYKKSKQIYWIPVDVLKFDTIDQTLLLITNEVNPIIHNGDEDLFTTLKFENIFFFLERFIVWYFRKYKIDITLYDSVVKRHYGSKGKAFGQNGCFKLSSEYWKSLAEKCILGKGSILQNFYLRTDETLTQEVIAIEAHESDLRSEPSYHKIVEVSQKNEKRKSAEKFGDLINMCFSLNCSVLLKVFAPSGEGKTVFLNKLAFYYSHQLQKCVVYYIYNVTPETINFLKSELDAANKPLLFILDTPSKYADILNENFAGICEKNYKPFVMIIGDQESRFNQKLSGKSWDNNFESYFSEVYKVDFELTQNEKLNIYEKFIMILRQNEDFTKDRDITIKGIYNNTLHLTIREQIYRITKYIEGNINTKHIQDWDVWEQITKDESLKKFRDLFSFVAVFAFYEIPVPISIFNYGYLPQVTELEDEDFISFQSNNSIIKINNNKLELRHEQIPKWYFEIPDHTNKKVRILKRFLKDFERVLDSEGCYLFRNIHNLIEDANLVKEFSRTERKRILTSYYKNVGFTDLDCPKIITELAKLEEIRSDKIGWLDKVIEANEGDIHARTFKVQLLISDEQYNSAQIILDKLFEISENVTRTLNNQFTLDVKSKRSFTSEKYIELARAKKDTYKALYELARRMQGYKNLISVALNILTFLKDIEPQNPHAPMVIANIFRQKGSKMGNEMAIVELKSILANDETYIPAILLLADIYNHSDEIENVEKTEAILLEGIAMKANQSALYVRLIKLYRERKNLIKDAAKKTSTILDKGLEEQSLGLKMQIRTEYAKWCFENFDDIDKHQTAIDFHYGTIKLYPSHIHSRVELGIIYQKSIFFKDLDASVSILRECFNIRFSQKDVAFRVVLANTLMLKNTQSSWKEARDILENAKLINPKNQSTYFGLIKIYQYFKDSEKLEETMKAVGVSTQKSASFLSSQVQQLIKSGKNEEAIEILKHALVEHDNNYFFLNQVAQILFNQASNERIKEDSNFSASNQRKNSMLLLAEKYLLKSLSDFQKNENTLFLLIQVYDRYNYDRSIENQKYRNAITQRNKRLEELYSLNENNPFLINALDKIFIFSRKPMLAIFILEKSDTTNYSSEQKLKYLIQLKETYKIFNDSKKIAEVTIQFNLIAQQRGDFQKILQAFNKYKFIERDNYKLLQIFNIGFIDPSFEFIEFNGDLIPIVLANRKISNQVKIGQKVYFATFEIDNNIFADKIEPYFDKSLKMNLLDILPNKLNCLNNY